jgi:glycosyltransferase involved in cell wall biosynthesis
MIQDHAHEYLVDRGIFLSVIVPTKNESENLLPLLTRIRDATADHPTEVIIIDDSTDHTAETAGQSLERLRMVGQVIARPPHLRSDGLSGAVVAGIKHARGTWICVMDADLQHPPEVIASLVGRASELGADLVLGSRFASGASLEGLGPLRRLLSRTLTVAVRLVFPRRLAKVSDPLTGLFLFRRSAVDPGLLRPNGFKILLEILVRCPRLRVAELPFDFAPRHAGHSKGTLTEGTRFLRHVARLALWTHRTVLRFLVVGASGLAVNSAALAALRELAGLHYLVAALAATQFSTLWNFGLTEAWVFRHRDSQGRASARLAAYWSMNNLGFGLRGPLLTALVAGLGVHYLVSNLLSIFILTLLRYLVSDRWIWRPVRSAYDQKDFGFAYDIHGLVCVLSSFELPELEHFRRTGIQSKPDIRLRIERRREARPAEDSVHYVEWLGRYGFEVTVDYRQPIEISVSPLLMRSPHVLYTNVVEPILRWLFVRKGFALVHGACLSLDGRASLVTAGTDTGKTTTILQVLAGNPWAFLSDDMTILTRDGRVLSYPKPLTISRHTLRAVDTARLSRRERLALQIQSRLHSRSGRLIGLLLGKTIMPAASLNAWVQLLIPPPKYGIQRLVPRVSIASSAALANVVLIERGPEQQERMDGQHIVDVLIQNAEDAYGFPPYPRLARFLSQWRGQDLHGEEREIIGEALNGHAATRLRDPQFGWSQRLPTLLSAP